MTGPAVKFPSNIPGGSRQWEVFTLIATRRANTVSAIANTLKISPTMVATTIWHLRQKKLLSKETKRCYLLSATGQDVADFMREIWKPEIVGSEP